MFVHTEMKFGCFVDDVVAVPAKHSGSVCGPVFVNLGVLLHCALSLAAQSILIGPVCLRVCVCGCVYLWVCYHDNSKLRASLHQTGSVGAGSDHLQLIEFCPSCAPGKGVCGGTKFLAPPYYSQRAVFASL